MGRGYVLTVMEIDEHEHVDEEIRSASNYLCEIITAVWSGKCKDLLVQGWINL